MSDEPAAEPTPSPATDDAVGPDTTAPPPSATSGTARPARTGERDTASDKLTRLAARGIGRAVKTARNTMDAARSNDTVSRALDGVKEQVGEHPRTAEKLARRATFTAMTAAAAASPTPMAKLRVRRATPIVVNQVGRAVNRIATGTEGEELTETGLAKLASRLAARPRPNPAELYRDGTDTLELRHPLPPELAAIAWEPLGRKDRFCLLVAAWAYREADGVESIKDGQFGQATVIFQECLVRAEYLRTPELVVRSYEDLAQVAAAQGDEKATRNLRLAAAQTREEAGLKPDDKTRDRR